MVQFLKVAEQEDEKNCKDSVINCSIPTDGSTYTFVPSR